MENNVAYKDAYEVMVVFKIRKSWTVIASSKEEAIEKLQDSGIVNPNCESANEYYNEEYEVLNIVQVNKPDVD